MRGDKPEEAILPSVTKDVLFFHFLVRYLLSSVL